MRVSIYSDRLRPDSDLSLALQTAGFDGADSIRSFSASNHPENIDLILIDLVNGHETGAVTGLEFLRTMKVHKDQFVIALTTQEFILDAVRSGATDVLIEGADFNEEVAQLKHRLQLQNEKLAGRIVAVVGASGGCGRSTLATNLAAAFAQSHGESGLIDLHLGGGDQATLLSLRPRHTIADLARNWRQLDLAMFEQALTAHESGVKLLASPPMMQPTGEVDRHCVDRIFSLARKRFSHVVVDVEDAVHREQTQALIEADVILMVFRLDFVSLLRTRKTLMKLGQLGVDASRVRLIANRRGQPNELSVSKASQALGQKVTDSIPDDPKTMIASVNVGESAFIESPNSKSAKAIGRIADALAC